MELASHIWIIRLGNLRIGYAIKRELLTMNMYGLTEFRHGTRMLVFSWEIAMISALKTANGQGAKVCYNAKLLMPDKIMEKYGTVPMWTLYSRYLICTKGR